MSRSVRSISPSIIAAARLAALALLVASCANNASAAQSPPPSTPPEATVTTKVGEQPDGTVQLAHGSLLSPAGIQVELPNVMPQSVAMHPQLSRAYVAGSTSEVIAIDPTNGKIVQRSKLPSALRNEPVAECVNPSSLAADNRAKNSFCGLLCSPDGKRLFMSNRSGNIKVFSIGADGRLTPSHSLPLPKPTLSGRTEEIPAGLALSADQTKLYVALNYSNQLLEMDAATGRELRRWNTGIAPLEVVRAGNLLAVGNWAGHRPKPGDTTHPLGGNAVATVDPKTDRPVDGSVTFIDLQGGETSEQSVGLHPTGLAVSPDKKWLAVTCSASEHVAVLDLSSRKLQEKISVKAGGPDEPFGAQPVAITFAGDHRLLVANGTHNAVAVIDFDPAERESKLRGLIPTGAFPSAIALDRNGKRFMVANCRGLGSGIAHAREGKNQSSYDLFGTVSLIDLPDAAQLDLYTKQCWRNLHLPRLAAAFLPARPGVKPQPVPERSGEPSSIKHIIYIIKENRTYDQIFGDMPAGRGRKDLCTFGEDITPNQHRLAREYVLMDNAYCSGIVSMEGHHWALAGIANEYVTKTLAAGFGLRTYPALKADPDALCYPESGYIWDAAIRHNIHLRIFGEASKGDFRFKSGARNFPTWENFLTDSAAPAGKEQIACKDTAHLPHLQPYMATGGYSYDPRVPDVFRVAKFEQDLAEFERKGGFPQLSIVLLGSDHTRATSPGAPTPAAHIADNDLALGRFVEAMSRSSFWKDTLIIAMEDDPQAGWDHVSAYRTVLLLAGPHVRRNAVISSQYNQCSVLRTIELILGVPPMNLLTATAQPMRDCFTSVPVVRRYESATPKQSLTEYNPPLKASADARLKAMADQVAAMDFSKPDQCPEDQLNRILWHAMKGLDSPFPDWATAMTAADKD